MSDIVPLINAKLTELEQTINTVLGPPINLEKSAGIFGKQLLAVATEAAAIALLKAIQSTDPRLTDARTPLAHSHPLDQLTGSTAIGRAVLAATTEAAARTAIGAGTSNLVLGTTAATAKAGNYTPSGSEIIASLGFTPYSSLNPAGYITGAGNAATAAKLATARNISIGNISKSFDGTTNISFTHEETIPARLREVAQTITDWNSAIANGWYKGPPGSANAPEATNWWFGEILANSSSEIIQTLYNLPTDASTATAWRRSRAGGDWNEWFKLQLTQYEQDNRYVRLAVAETIAGAKTFTNTSMFTNRNAAIYAFGGYQLINRNDGESYHQLLSDLNVAAGTWNDYRPYMVTLATGAVAIRSDSLGGSVSVAAGATASGNTMTVNINTGNLTGSTAVTNIGNNNTSNGTSTVNINTGTGGSSASNTNIGNPNTTSGSINLRQNTNITSNGPYPRQVGITTRSATTNAYGYRLQSTQAAAMLNVTSGKDFLLLFTEDGDPDGTFSSLRPIRVNMTTGEVTLAHGIKDSLVINGDQLSIGSSTSTTEKCYRMSNQNTTGYHFLSATGVLGFYDEIRAKVRWGSDTNGLFNINGNLYVDGTASWQSDKRMKKSVKKIGFVLPKLLRLCAVSYRWIKTNKYDEGLLAQDVLKIFPILVTENDVVSVDSVYKTKKTTKVFGIDYGKLSIYAVKAIQELVWLNITLVICFLAYLYFGG